MLPTVEGRRSGRLQRRRVRRCALVQRQHRATWLLAAGRSGQCPCDSSGRDTPTVQVPSERRTFERIVKRRKMGTTGGNQKSELRSPGGALVMRNLCTG